MRGESMKNDIIRIPVRFNLSDPDQAEVVKFLRNMTKNFSTSMSGFIIDSIRFYIENMPADVSKGFSRDYVTKSVFDQVLNERDTQLRLWMYDKLISMMTYSKAATTIEDLKSEKAQELQIKNVDLTNFPDIMEDVTSWSEG